MLSTGTRGSEVVHSELRGVFRQVYNVSVPTFQETLDHLTLSKQITLDAPPLRLMTPRLFSGKGQ